MVRAKNRDTLSYKKIVLQQVHDTLLSPLCNLTLRLMGSSTRSSSVLPLLPGGGLTSRTSSTPPPPGFPVPEAFSGMVAAGLDASDTLAPGMLLHDGRVTNPFDGASPALGGSPRRLGSTCNRV